MGLILLQLFGCGPEGIDPHAPDLAPDPSLSFHKDAMPLVLLLDPGSLTGSDLSTYEANINMTRGYVQTRNNRDFQEYLLTDTNISRQPVHALTTGYLHYLRPGPSYPAILGGTEAQANEKILVLLPLANIADEWKNRIRVRCH